MNCCDSQKAECYQGRCCNLRQTNGGLKIDNGLLVEMFDEPNEWLHTLISIMFVLGVAGLLVWIGFLAAKLFN